MRTFLHVVSKHPPSSFFIKCSAPRRTSHSDMKRSAVRNLLQLSASRFKPPHMPSPTTSKLDSTTQAGYWSSKPRTPRTGQCTPVICWRLRRGQGGMRERMNEPANGRATWTWTYVDEIGSRHGASVRQVDYVRGMRTWLGRWGSTVEWY